MIDEYLLEGFYNHLHYFHLNNLFNFSDYDLTFNCSDKEYYYLLGVSISFQT